MTSLRLLLLAASAALAPGLATAGEAQTSKETSPGHALVTTGAKRVRAQLTVRFHAPRLEADEWAVYAARLPELPGQVGVRSAILPAGVDLVESGDQARPLLGTRVVVDDPRRRAELTVRVEYAATLLARKLVPLADGEAPPTKVAPIGPAEARLALASSGKFDHDAPPVRSWLDGHKLGRAPGEGDVDLARRVFLEVRKGLTISGDRVTHEASRAFETGKTDAAGLVIAAVSAFRGVGLPARLLAGRRAESSSVEPLSRRVNDPLRMRAEVFARGVGWIPVDVLAAARDDPAGGTSGFGVDEGDFVAFHVGNDLVLDTFFGPKTMEWLQDPSFWALGGGDFEGASTRSEWVVKAEPVDPASAMAKAPGSRPSSRASRQVPARRARP